jgi:plasmid stability protein
MPVTITIRNVPDDVRNRLAARAARSGRSLQEFLLAELTSAAAGLTVDDIVDQVRPFTATTTISAHRIVDDAHADRR